MVTSHTAQVDGLSVFYREAGDPASPKLLLLGGFPASSHQFRNLIPALADRFHVLSPDYPGFGNTDMPDPAEWDYTFDHLTDVVDGLLHEVRFTGPMGIYMQDYGGPIGNRLIRAPSRLAAVAGHPERQQLRGGLHRRVGRHPTRAVGGPQTRDRGATGGVPSARHRQGGLHDRPPRPQQDQSRQLEHGSVLPGATERAPGATGPLYDYRTNAELYPSWQASLRERQPLTLILWGQGDIFFTPKAARPTCAISRRPSCTCSTAATSPSRTPSSRSRHTSSASTTTRSMAPAPDRAHPDREHPMRVLSVNAGLPRKVAWKGKPVTTGIYKEPVDGPVRIRTLNLEGDRQADLRVHGGWDKAVYAYASEFYELWRRSGRSSTSPWGSSVRT